MSRRTSNFKPKDSKPNTTEHAIHCPNKCDIVYYFSAAKEGRRCNTHEKELNLAG